MKFALLVCLLVSPVAIAGETFWQCMNHFMPQWIPAGMDIDAMQALDSSYSVQNSGFINGKFAAKIVNKDFIDVLTNNGITWNMAGSRSGFIRMASLANTNIPIHLFSFPNAQTLNAAIEAQVYTGGATAMAKALYLARREFTSFSNAARKKRVMLITDGYETEGGKPLLQANLLKTGHRAEICVITIGNNHNDELKQLATWYGRRPCICGTRTWFTLKRDMIKAAKMIKPVIKQRRKNRRKQLKQQN